MSTSNLDAEVNLMLDLETLGLTGGCAVISMAAVPFASNCAVESFYEKVSPGSCIKNGLTTDDRTVAWWKNQSKEAYDEAFSGTKSILVVLAEFSNYLSHLPASTRIWGNGADFDNVILAAAYDALGIKTPWKYTNNRCYRTLKNLAPQIPYTPPAIKHNAYQDAAAQAEHAARILKWIKSR